VAVGALFFLLNKNNKQVEKASTVESGNNIKINSQNTNSDEQMMQQSDGEIVPINEQNSVLAWNAKKIIGNPNHNGEVGIKNGALRIYKDEIVGGDFVIDMTSLVVTDGSGGRLEQHLRSEDFFDVEKNPEARLSILSVEKTNDGFFVVANLTIKGITNKIDFPVTVNKSSEKISADASFSIDRTKWNITYGSGSFFDDLGDQAIDDMINFDVHVET
jgi:hypothetical protein